MTTVEIDLTDPANFQCNLFGAGTSSSQSAVTPEFAAKVFQRYVTFFHSFPHCEGRYN